MTCKSTFVVLLATQLVMWPSFAIAQGAEPTAFLAFLRSEHWPCLVVAVALDAIALAWGINWGWGRAGFAAVVLNGLGYFAGFVLYPLAGLVLVYPISALSVATGPAGEVLFWILVATSYAIVDTGVQWSALVVLFRPERPRRAFGVLAAANLVSGAALVAMVWFADRPATISKSEVARLEAEYAPKISFLTACFDEMKLLETP